MARPRRLTAAFVRTVTEPGRYGDGWGGFGLSLLVKRRAHGGLALSWSQRLWIDDGPVNVGLGAYPIVTLSEARQRALNNRRMVEQGGDPRKPTSTAPTFAEAVEAVIALHAPTWKAGRARDGQAQQWRSSLERFAYPVLGKMLVDKIDSGDVVRVVGPIWNDMRPTAERILGRIGQVMKWAVGQGFRDDNPAGDSVKAALPRNGARQAHHKAVAHADVADVLRRVQDESLASESAKLAFRFLVLTASRSTEAREARWDEIDGETWIVPPARMKSGREHRVPLARQSVAVLDEARKLADGSGYIFPSSTRRGRPLSVNSVTTILRELHVNGVAHGFRSSFRDWCSDTGQPRELAESALAHVLRDRTESAYARSDLLDRRAPLMQKWANYLA